MMNLSKFKALLIIAVVFLLGAVAGASLSRTVLRSISAWGPHHHSRGPFIERLQQRLDLSGEQRTQIQAILDESHQQFRGLHKSVKPQFESIRQQMSERIRKELNPDQVREFAAMHAEYEQRRARRGKKYR
jgi:Spy/CpxP family protein refolding chaperone